MLIVIRIVYVNTNNIEKKIYEESEKSDEK